MQVIDIPTERTTAITDAILAIFAISAIVYLSRIATQDPLKMKIWCGLFAFVAIAAALGAVVHGLVIPSRLKRVLWQPLALALALSVVMLSVGIAYDMWGIFAIRRVMPASLMLMLGFYALANFTSFGKILVVVLVTCILFFALFAYTVQAIRGQINGAWLMSVSFWVTIIAGIIQASRLVSFKFVWEFDHNGTFHLVQLLGLFLLILGLRDYFL
jgi:hypothetical protein